MSGRALITGSEGFAGRALCAYLEASGVEALGCDLRVPQSDSRFACDITDASQVEALLAWAAPCDTVYHLAAAASVAEGLTAPGLFMRVNIEGAVNLCEAMARSLPDARLVFIGSAEVYGAPAYLPMDESHPLHPVNPYAISKLAAEQYCRYMHQCRGLDVVMLRPFNHSGPGQRDQFVLSSFARQLIEIERGLRAPTLRVGNLEAKRDFMHVSDVTRAYALAARQGESGEVYNLCSGEAVSIAHALDRLRALSGVVCEIERDPERYRPVDVPELRGCCEKFQRRTGWRPEASFTQMLQELLDWWRAEL